MTSGAQIMANKFPFKISAAFVALLFCALFFGFPVKSTVKAGDITGGEIAPHVNIAAFHALHGQENFKFPKHINGDNILNSLAGKAQFIFINHTAGLKDGDVIMTGSDVLRDNSGHFEDFGVDCQLSVHIKNNDVTLAGVCTFLMVDQDRREIEHKGIVPPHTLHPNQDWVLVYYNAEDGIAIYADQEVGLE